MAKRKRTHNDHVYVVCVCLGIEVVNTYCVVLYFVVLRLVYPMLPVSLDCPFLIVPSLFSYVYYLHNTVENLKIEQDE